MLFNYILAKRSFNVTLSTYLLFSFYHFRKCIVYYFWRQENLVFHPFLKWLKWWGPSCSEAVRSSDSNVWICIWITMYNFPLYKFKFRRLNFVFKILWWFPRVHFVKSPTLKQFVLMMTSDTFQLGSIVYDSKNFILNYAVLR